MADFSEENVDSLIDPHKDNDGFINLSQSNQEDLESSIKNLEELESSSNSDDLQNDGEDLYIDAKELSAKQLKDIISSAIDKGLFLSPEVLDVISESDFDYESFIESLSKNQNLLYVDESLLKNHDSIDFNDLNWFDFDKAVVEKEVNNNPKMYDSFLEFLDKNKRFFPEKNNHGEHRPFFDEHSDLHITLIDNLNTSAVESLQYNSNVSNITQESNLNNTSEKQSGRNSAVTNSGSLSDSKNADTKKKNELLTSGVFNHEFEGLPSNVEVVSSYTALDKKLDVKNFVNYYGNRLKSFVRILSSRPELEGLRSISKLKGDGEVSIIGLISNIVDTKNAIFLDVEDNTGVVRVIVTKDNRELLEIANELVLDQAVGVRGFLKNKVIYAKSIIEAGVPNSIPIKKAKEDVNLAIISDLHVGSRLFLEKEFLNFISWINGKYGSDKQKEMGLRTKYLIIAGDLVDGVGVYPGQKDELKITSIKKQYDYAAYLLSKIRKDVTIIIAPGNHDAVRLAEPQPPLDKDFAKSLYELENVIHVSNPATLRIHKVNNFPGFKVLIYHGYSFDYYIRNIDYLRVNGGFDRFDLVMKFLLNKRHLSPSHGATLFVPDPEKDPLIIEEVPDIFVVGHNHRPNVGVYNNIVLVSGGTWQLKTPFQEKIGHDPLPGRVPVFNLKSRKINLLRFV